MWLGLRLGYGSAALCPCAGGSARPPNPNPDPNPNHRWLCSPPVILSLVFLFVYSIVVYIGLVRRPSMPVVVVVGGGGSNPFGRLVSFRISQRS